MFLGLEEGSGAGMSPLSGRYFIVIGAGGAGKAIAYGAKQRGAKVIIANRNYGMLHMQIQPHLTYTILCLTVENMFCENLVLVVINRIYALNNLVLV